LRRPRVFDAVQSLVGVFDGLSDRLRGRLALWGVGDGCTKQTDALRVRADTKMSDDGAESHASGLEAPRWMTTLCYPDAEPGGAASGAASAWPSNAPSWTEESDPPGVVDDMLAALAALREASTVDGGHVRETDFFARFYRRPFDSKMVPPVVVASEGDIARRSLLHELGRSALRLMSSKYQVDRRCCVLGGAVGTGKSTLLAAAALAIHVLTRGEVACGILSKVPCGRVVVRDADAGDIVLHDSDGPVPLRMLAFYVAYSSGHMTGADLKAALDPNQKDYVVLRQPVLLLLDEWQTMFLPPDLQEHVNQWMRDLCSHIQSTKDEFAVCLCGSASQVPTMARGGHILDTVQFSSYTAGAWHVNTTKTAWVTLTRTWSRKGFIELLRHASNADHRAIGEACASDSPSSESLSALASIYNACKGNVRYATEGMSEAISPDSDTMRRAHDAMLSIAMLQMRLDDIVLGDDADPFDFSAEETTFPVRAVAFDGRTLSEEEAVTLADRGLLVLRDGKVAFSHPAFVLEALQRHKMGDYGLTYEQRMFVVRPGADAARTVGEELATRSLGATLIPAIAAHAVWSAVGPTVALRKMQTKKHPMRESRVLELCRGALSFTVDNVCYIPDGDPAGAVRFGYDEWVCPSNDYFGADRIVVLRKRNFFRTALDAVIVVLVQYKLGKVKPGSTTTDIALGEAVYKLERGWLGGVEAKRRRDSAGNSWAAGDRVCDDGVHGRLDVLNQAAHRGLRARITAPSGVPIHCVCCVVTNHHVTDSVPTRKWEQRLASIAAGGENGALGGGVVLGGSRVASLWLPEIRRFAARVGSHHFSGAHQATAGDRVAVLATADVGLDAALLEWERCLVRVNRPNYMAVPLHVKFPQGLRDLRDEVDSGDVTAESLAEYLGFTDAGHARAIIREARGASRHIARHTQE